MGIADSCMEPVGGNLSFQQMVPHGDSQSKVSLVSGVLQVITNNVKVKLSSLPNQNSSITLKDIIQDSL